MPISVFQFTIGLWDDLGHAGQFILLLSFIYTMFEIIKLLKKLVILIVEYFIHATNRNRFIRTVSSLHERQIPEDYLPLRSERLVDTEPQTPQSLRPA